MIQLKMMIWRYVHLYRKTIRQNNWNFHKAKIPTTERFLQNNECIQKFIALVFPRKILFLIEI